MLWMFSTTCWVSAWMALICALLFSRLGGLARQRLDFARDHRKALAGFAGAGRFDGGVERQQIGLAGDGLDQPDHFADARGGLAQLLHGCDSSLRLGDGAARDVGRFCRLRGDLAD